MLVTWVLTRRCADCGIIYFKIRRRQLHIAELYVESSVPSANPSYQRVWQLSTKSAYLLHAAGIEGSTLERCYCMGPGEPSLRVSPR